MNPRDLWHIDGSIKFLNHGSFGACPKAVLEKQSALRLRLESEPVQFMARDLEEELDEARSVLGEFVGAPPEGLVFVPNATTAVNTVLHSLELRPGDEILTTNHAYPSCLNAVNYIARRTGALPVIAEIPFPIRSTGEIVDRVIRSASRKTKICLLDHITSPTALIFPVSGIVRELKERGIDSLVDGAHAPGMIPLNIEEIGAAFYTGNCHKWLCAPKGAGFLYVAEEKRNTIHPLVTSLGAGSGRSDRPGFHLEFDWVGTDDPTAYLCVPEAIRYMGALLKGGWPELMDSNRKKILAARKTICDAVGVGHPSPEGMIGSMSSIPLPTGDSTSVEETGDNDPIHRELFNSYDIEVPVIAWPNPPKRVLRISAQVYNTAAEYEHLADALGEILD